MKRPCTASPASTRRASRRLTPLGLATLALHALALLALGLLAPGASEAAPPGRWAQARARPEARAEEQALAAAEGELLAARRLRRRGAIDPLAATGALVHRQEALRILREAHGAEAVDPELRFLQAQVLSDVGRWAEAVPILEQVIDVLPASSRIDAWVELAVAYARLGRTRDEIGCYDRALALEPHTSSRATMLANQAEAFMSIGDVPRAVAGYRASLAQLTPNEQIFAPTTFWGLGVALDRSGELDQALDAIAQARALDPADRRLESDGWFYNPAHDEAWYAGLGHLLVARRGPDLEIREAAYQRAIDRFEAYVERAPPSDPWLPAARARVVALKKEEAKFAQRTREQRRRRGDRPATGPGKARPAPR